MCSAQMILVHEGGRWRLGMLFGGGGGGVGGGRGVGVGGGGRVLVVRDA